MMMINIFVFVLLKEFLFELTVNPWAINSSGTNSGLNFAGVIHGKRVFTGSNVTIISPLAMKWDFFVVIIVNKMKIYWNIPKPSLIRPLESSIVRSVLPGVPDIITLLDGSSITAGCDVLLRFKLGCVTLTGRCFVELILLLLLLFNEEDKDEEPDVAVLFGEIVFGDALAVERLSIVTWTDSVVRTAGVSISNGCVYVERCKIKKMKGKELGNSHLLRKCTRAINAEMIEKNYVSVKQEWYEYDAHLLIFYSIIHIPKWP